MATNFEFYIDALIETLKAKDQENCSGRTAQVTLCMEETDAYTCCKKSCANCWADILETLKQEHIEQPKLTKRERAFCEAVQTGWLARDYSGNLAWRDNKPEKVQETHDKYWLGNGSIVVWVHALFKEDGFGFIQWKDEKPWSIEELLKLEVMEE